MSGEKLVRLSAALSSVMAVESECARSGRFDAAYACARIARMIERADVVEDPSEANKRTIREALTESLVVTVMRDPDNKTSIYLPTYIYDAARAAVGLEPL